MTQAFPGLGRAHALALDSLQGLADRPVDTAAVHQQLRFAPRGAVPETSSDAGRVIEQLAPAAAPGPVASAGPRFFGFVTGGAVAVATAAHCLASARNRHAALHVMAPAVSVTEEVVAAWQLGILGLSAQCPLSFVTGCHMTNLDAAGS